MPTPTSQVDDQTHAVDLPHANGNVVGAPVPHLTLHPSMNAHSFTSPIPSPARLRKVSSVLSGEDADSEPSSGGSSLAGSSESLVRMGHYTPLRRGTRSRATSFGGEETEADREVRMVMQAQQAAGSASAVPSVPNSPAQAPAKGKNASSSSLNLLLSSHLSHHFTPPAGSAIQSTSHSGPSFFRRFFSPFESLSQRGVIYYTLASGVMYYLTKAASRRANINRTMLTFIPPFLVREAPHLFAGLTALGMLRTAIQLQRELPPFLLIGWAANVLSLLGLVSLFRRMVRIGGSPFRAALRDARVGVPQAEQEDVLTIVPVQRTELEPLPNVEQGEDPLQKSAFAEYKDEPAPTPPPQAEPITAASSPSTLPMSTEEKAYDRVGRMTPLRWFLATTQLTKTLAWFEEVQWRTGVVYESIQTRQKTHALKLDIYRPKVTPQAGRSLPCFLYIHGGGWITGHRSFHSLTMLYAIAKSGWIVASINYRLSPQVKHPTHLMDCKRSLAWLRSNAPAYGGDPSFVVVGGESAGAHLACLMALTPNVLHLQPGFENVDTSVQGAVDLYGCHDFTDSHYHFRSREDPHSWLGGFDAFLHRFVMGRRLSEAKPLYEMASPYFRLQWSTPGQAIPPFFGSHGTHDDLIPMEDSEVFYQKLKEKRAEEKQFHDEQTKQWMAEVARLKREDPSAPIPAAPLPLLPAMDVFVPVPHASHAYNNVMSPRSFALNDSVTVWLSALLKAYRARDDLQVRRSTQWESSRPGLMTLAPSPTPTALLLERREAEDVAAAERAEELRTQSLSPSQQTTGKPLFSLIPKL